jgi:60 kDa SS-A/Ro ribonucleoprotein
LVVNEAGGLGYDPGARHQLAQYAATGCLNSTYYASDDEQRRAILDLARRVEPDYLARVALYARRRGRMKDMPALLLALLSRRDPALFERVFPQVIDSPRTLRTFVEIVRSGQAGRRPFGTVAKRAIRHWLEARSETQLLHASVGSRPSLADIVAMVHPRPATDARRAFYAWLLGKPHDENLLSEEVRAYQRRLADASQPLPRVPFEMALGLQMTADEWVELAQRCSWQQLRMNLNNFARHGVFGTTGTASVEGE